MVCFPAVSTGHLKSGLPLTIWAVAAEARAKVATAAANIIFFFWGWEDYGQRNVRGQKVHHAVFEGFRIVREKDSRVLVAIQRANETPQHVRYSRRSII